MYDSGVAGGTLVATNSMFSSQGKTHCKSEVLTSSLAVWKRFVISIKDLSNPICIPF